MQLFKGDTAMTTTVERRSEARLRYSWPIWFAENFNGMLNQGQMIDISSGGAAFTCYASNCPSQGESIATRFSVPRYSEDDSFELDNFIRSGRVCRIDELSPYLRRVAVQFAKPLPFKPAQPSALPQAAIDEPEFAQV
jgi:hypothetical protein